MFSKNKRTRAQLEKEFLNLDFTSDFLFSELMKEEALCKELIETLLKIKIDKIVYHKIQKKIRHNKDCHGVRLDVYVKDTDRVFDIEMQVKHYENLPMRARYYQSNIDLDCLNKNEKYTALPESYVIFICAGDPFGRNLPVYTARTFIEEDFDIRYNDSNWKLFFNAKAWRLCQDEEVKAFLKYLSTKETSSGFTSGIADRIKCAHRNIRLKDRFMTFRMKIDEEREYARMEGREEGYAEGKAEGRAVGHAEGHAEGHEEGYALGKAEGKAEGMTEMAKQMLLNGIDPKLVVKCSGIPEEVVERLAAEIAR